MLEQDQTSQWVFSSTWVLDAVKEADMDMPRAELEKLLYTAENLRKKDMEDADMDTDR